MRSRRSFALSNFLSFPHTTRATTSAHEAGCVHWSNNDCISSRHPLSSFAGPSVTKLRLFFYFFNSIHPPRHRPFTVPNLFFFSSLHAVVWFPFASESYI